MFKQYQNGGNKNDGNKNDGNKNDGNKNDDGGGNKNPNEYWSWNEAILATIVLSAFFFLPNSSRNGAHEISFQEFLQNHLGPKVERLTVDLNGRVYVELFEKQVSRMFFTIGSIETFERRLHAAQKQRGIEPKDYVKVTYIQENLYIQEIIKFLPTLAIIGVIYFMFGRSRGGSKGGASRGIFDIGKSNPTIINKGTKVGVTFKDVAGLHEAKEEVMEFVHFLKSPEKYERLGAKLPKGALLVGPPGTGKTLLAKATAGEAGVPFFSVSGSDFVEMFVGVGSSRVRDLFAQARANAPCIIFIDEIDAVGRARGEGGFQGGNDERENTLNQLLVEMDGFNSKQGAVVILAGTNRVDILDKALLRPGRFDRQISIDKPDQIGREEIFMVHLKPIKLANEDRSSLAKRLAALTPGFAGADIANVCNEGALIAARARATSVEVRHFESAIERVIGGLEKKSKVMSKLEKTIIAYHEAGHAIAGWYLEHCNPVLKVSIIPRGESSLGFSQLLSKEQFLYNTQQLFDMMCMTLGGRAAEQLKFNHFSTGATDDIQKVTRLATAQILDYGMNGNIGQISFRKQSGGYSFEKPYSESTHEKIDSEVRLLIQKAYDRVFELLTSKKDELEKLAQYLLKHEVANHKDIIGILGPRPYPYDDKQEEMLSAAFKGTANESPSESAKQ